MTMHVVRKQNQYSLLKKGAGALGYQLPHEAHCAKPSSSCKISRPPQPPQAGRRVDENKIRSKLRQHMNIKDHSFPFHFPPPTTQPN